MRVLLLLFVICSFALSQEREWKPKSFDSLGVASPDILEEEEDLQMKYSAGYFPIPMNWSFTTGIIFQPAIMANTAKHIRPTGMVRTNFDYSGVFHSDDAYLDYKQKFSDDNESNSLDNDSYGIGLELLLTPKLGIPVQLRASSLITWNTGMLYSEDKSKSFLDYNNNSRNYLEVGVILLEETIFELNTGINIPIYGAFISQQTDFSSLYTLYLGTNITKVISSSATQYLQIGDVKDKIRYENGLDTIKIQNGMELPTLRKSRFAIEFGLGTSFEVDGYGALMEMKASIPTESILYDSFWKQNRLIFGFTFYFGGVFR